MTQSKQKGADEQLREKSTSQGSRNVRPNKKDNSAKGLTQNDIHIDPNYERLVPRPTIEECEALKESIAREGQRDPIIVSVEGVVLDGHTRFKVLRELAKPIKFKVRSSSSKEEEESFVIEAAVLRRNLSTFQKIELAQASLNRARELARQRQKQGTLLSNEREVGEAMAVVAKRFGIPRATFARGQYILEEGNAEQIASLEKGNATINGVYSVLKTRSAEKDQSKVESAKHSSNDESQEISVEPIASKEIEQAVQSSKKEGEGLDIKAECKQCHKMVTRADLKLVLLCTQCRREAGINF
ncbi:MAG: ParB N-terminal domain-containing protein [Thaumarchaeota archaeon]|nr:ParB N-terminal domain-containing protein [Nitrososphaerota archaeon]